MNENKSDGICHVHGQVIYSKSATYSGQRVILGGRGRRGGKQRDHRVYLNDKNVILRVIYACRPATVHCKMNCNRL